MADLSPADLRVLAALATGGAGADLLTIADLARALGGHPNTTRAHLGRLLREGLVERVARASGSRGRPAHGHRLTDLGRLALEASPAGEGVPAASEVVSAMAEYLATTPDHELQARRIGRGWAALLVDRISGVTRGGPGPSTVTDPLDTMVTALRVAGFSPQSDPQGDLLLRTCPVLSSARAFPEVVCTMHEEMLRSTLERSGATDIGVSLVPFAREGGCLVRLRRGRVAREGAV